MGRRAEVDLLGVIGKFALKYVVRSATTRRPSGAKACTSIFNGGLETTLLESRC